MGSNILELKNICKNFPGVVALDDVSFCVKRGEVHALMGENGAGKSTLVKIITGVYQRDGGEIIFDDRAINPRSVHESSQEGISAIFQELNMVPHLSISENIFVGQYPKKNGVIQWQLIHDQAQKMLSEIGLMLDVKAELATQSTAIQQMVAIVRAINTNAKLIVMDEPTSSLDTQETNTLFKIIRQLKEKSITTIFISHRLDEIFEVCDTVSVLKDGKYEGTYEAASLTKYELVKKMVGREVNQKKRIVECQKSFEDGYLCEISHAKWKNKVKDVSFSIQKGEILGLAGLLGSGRTESAKLLFGCNALDDGEIVYEGKNVKLKTPRDAVKRKIAFCSENRRVEGIIPNLSVEDNIALVHLPELSNALGGIDKKKKSEIANKYIDELMIKTPSPKQKIKNLSGGNQQKVLLARWLCMQPKLIILDEPTRGIDVGAKSEIEKLIHQFSEQGISVLMISSELEELVRNCDRIVVIREGENIAELCGEDIHEETIIQKIAEHHNTGEGIN